MGHLNLKNVSYLYKLVCAMASLACMVFDSGPLDEFKGPVGTAHRWYYFNTFVFRFSVAKVLVGLIRKLHENIFFSLLLALLRYSFCNKSISLMT